MNDILALARPDILTLKAYSHASWDPAFEVGRKVVQLDYCPNEIGKAFPVRDASAGHLPTLIERITDHLADIPEDAVARRSDAIRQLLIRYPTHAQETTSTKVPPLPQRIVADVMIR